MGTCELCTQFTKPSKDQTSCIEVECSGKTPRKAKNGSCTECPD